MKKFVLATTMALLASGVAIADNHPTGDDAILARQAAMKAIGAAAKAADFAAMNEAAQAAAVAFTADTRADGTLKTTAAPAIWDDKEGFDEIMEQMITLSAAGGPAVFGTCKTCHGAYRVK